ncbi:glycoside hydrolase family 2 [Croceivirga radicis]|uniref:glycoside hydrolase family 2 n=1 Tax=Croceivirga radicis TaxID=1929488 RepID=UPI000255B107|nr:glycoside hydrolase family 2 [Croceivirga radicis]
MKFTKFPLTLFLFIVGLATHAQNTSELNLSGTWQVQLAPSTIYPKLEKSEGTINLPGSLAQNGYGFKTKGADIGILTPTYKYIGIASYSREFEIPKSWKNKKITLFLERVLWQSEVWLDGKPLGKKDALGIPHIHELGNLKPGKHTLMVKVDNNMIYNIGDKGHAYSESTQTIWNGLVGELKLIAKDPTHFVDLKTISNLKEDKLEVWTKINASKASKISIFASIKHINGNDILLSDKYTFQLERGIQNINFHLNLMDKIKPWSEFDPEVYEITLSLKAGKNQDSIDSEFGFVEVAHNGTQVTINGEPVFLRGNLDNVHFPLTGYPSTKVEDWLAIFKTYKDYGLNHVRFHSWCPPQAAFKAANRMGIYIQAEASVWIDSWMNEDMIAKGRPEMETKGHPKGLGFNSHRDLWVQDEMKRVVDHYGNHPSFIMFCIGNELGSSDFEQTKEWIAKLKKYDNRRLYAGSTARKITENDDYTVTHLIDNVGWTRGLNGAHTNWDFEKAYSQMNIPILAHEIGQWPVYPTWSEIDKYTGILKARNLEDFKKVAQQNGIADQADAFKQATGALNQIMYKYEIESFLRTESCAGIQLLSMQDYQGQGEALVGWLDVFYDSKNITTPQQFKQHHNTVVPLLRTPKFVYDNTEHFTGTVQVSNFSKENLEDVKATITITDEENNTIYSDLWQNKTIPRAKLTTLGLIELPLNTVTKAGKYTVTIAIKGTEFKNQWNFWVFPKETEITLGKVVLAHEINPAILAQLHAGKKVLLNAHNLGTKKNSVNYNFYPLYWSYTYFPGQGKTSLGMLIQDKHKAMEGFPTDYHSDWQWETFDKKAKAFLLNETPKDYKPIIQLVDDFHRNNKEGLLFEFKVGKGKLLVSGFDLEDTTSVTAKQLKKSILQYMNSNAFVPTTTVSNEFLLNNFSEQPSTKTNDAILLEVKASGKLGKDKTQSWSADGDTVLKQYKNAAYTISNAFQANQNGSTYWKSNNVTVDLTCPDGFLGSLYVLVKRPKGTTDHMTITFEGRHKTIALKNEGDEQWIKFHVMREDSNDGKLELSVKSNTDLPAAAAELVVQMD